MGFSHEHAREALLNTATMEQATDYILTHPPPAAQVARVGTSENNFYGQGILTVLKQTGGGTWVRNEPRNIKSPKRFCEVK